MQAGMRGIFVTFHRGKERSAKAEIVDLLSEYADRYFPPDDEAAEESDRDDVEASIEKELSDLKAPKKKTDRIVPIELNTDCFFFVKLHRPIKPVELLEYIFADLAVAENKRSRYLQRLVPATRLCIAQLERIQECLKEVLPDSPLSEEAAPTTYAIELRRRNHDLLQREDIYKSVAESIPRKHTVDLKNSNVHIMLEVTKNICGISIVKDFRKYRKFNVQEMFEPEKDKRLVPAASQEDPSEKSALTNSTSNENGGENSFEATATPDNASPIPEKVSLSDKPLDANGYLAAIEWD